MKGKQNDLTEPLFLRYLFLDAAGVYREDKAIDMVEMVDEILDPVDDVINMELRETMFNFRGKMVFSRNFG